MTLEVGRSVFTEHNVKIHHYRGSLTITDLTNAGKRGKKVSELRVLVRGHGHSDAITNPMLEKVAEVLLRKSFAAMVAELAAHGDILDVTQESLRGIDVEAAATKIELSHHYDSGKRFILIESTPHDFKVLNRVYFGDKPPYSPHCDDMNYWPRKKADGALFYGWLRSHLSVAGSMSFRDIHDVWESIGVHTSSH